MVKADLLQLIEVYPISDSNKIVTQLFVEQYDDYWSKSNFVGQVTASSWVVNLKRDKALLTHHQKLNRWLQLGGHLEAEDKTIIDACLRELKEESGLKHFKLLSPCIFDIDVHKIPTSKKGVPEHFHFDIRFLFEADENEVIQFDNIESNEVKWIKNEDISHLVEENESILRMMEKVKNIAGKY